ncbi:Sensor protein ZraS [bacterium HR37]|nr:Sensor protein ZraS [bacterium HR37]
MNIERLNEAFQNFVVASKNLESYYKQLQEKVNYLTTELKRKNEQLEIALSEAEKSRDYLNAVLYNLEEAIIVVDQEERITTINRSAERILGLNAQEVIGKNFGSLECSIITDEPDTFLKVRDKSYHIIFSRSPIIDSKGNLRGSVILIKDITRLKEIEIQHERNKRFIAMGEMITKIAHEIRNSLCSIELFANILEKELEGKDLERFAIGISVGISNLNNTLTNMLSFVRDHKLQRKTVKLRNVIEEVLEMLMPLIETRRVSLKKTLTDSTILGDRELLKQTFMNVIINSIQAIKSDNGRVEINMREEEDFTIVDIKDNGVGIKKANMERIFDPFFSTKETGTGLGLTIVLKIMQNHNGYVRVWSEEGEGTQFSLYFPNSKHTEGLYET